MSDFGEVKGGTEEESDEELPNQYSGAWVCVHHHDFPFSYFLTSNLKEPMCVTAGQVMCGVNDGITSVASAIKAASRTAVTSEVHPLCHEVS